MIQWVTKFPIIGKLNISEESMYNWREELPSAECLCEICFDILNTEGKIKWKCK